jgi:hypothetical protein
MLNISKWYFIFSYLHISYYYVKVIIFFNCLRVFTEQLGSSIVCNISVNRGCIKNCLHLETISKIFDNFSFKKTQSQKLKCSKFNYSNKLKRLSNNKTNKKFLIKAFVEQKTLVQQKRLSNKNVCRTKTFVEQKRLSNKNVCRTKTFVEQKRLSIKNVCRTKTFVEQKLQTTKTIVKQ